MIREKFLWRIRDKDVAPKKVRCSTEKFVDGLQPFLDQDGETVHEGISYFSSESEAWAALLSMRKIALGVAETKLEMSKAAVVAAEKAVEDCAEDYDASLQAFEGPND